MKIAVTYESGMVFPHFGHAQAFKVYDVQDGEIKAAQVAPTQGSGHGALAGFLAGLGVDTLICGGIGAVARQALAQAGIRLYGGVKGEADAAVEARELTVEAVADLDRLEPCGTGNPRPVLVLRGALIQSMSQVGRGRHLKLRLESKGTPLDAIFFSADGAELGLAPGGRVDVAFYPQINEFRGTRSVQLQVADLHPAPTRAQAERAVYEKYRRGEGLTPAEARLLMPSRAEFVGLWRYLQRRCAGLGRVEDTASRIARGASRATGQREAAERVLLCLEVLAERGLIDLETGPQGVAVSLRQVERKVDLEASPILGRLRQAIRGGSAEA